LELLLWRGHIAYENFGMDEYRTFKYDLDYSYDEIPLIKKELEDYYEWCMQYDWTEYTKSKK
jgi:hypothetical protein